MKNPFKKQHNHTALIALSVTGAAAAGAIAYLYLTDSGSDTRGKLERSLNDTIDKLSDTFKDSIKDLAAGLVSAKTDISKKTVKAVADHVID